MIALLCALVILCLALSSATEGKVLLCCLAEIALLVLLIAAAAGMI